MSKEIIRKRFTNEEISEMYKEIHENLIAGFSRTDILDQLIKKYNLKLRTAEYHYDKCWENKILTLYERDFPILINKQLSRYKKIFESNRDFGRNYVKNPKTKQDFAKNQQVEREAKILIQAMKQEARLVGLYKENEITIINNDIKLNYHSPTKEKKTNLNLEMMDVDDLAKMFEILSKTKVDLQLANLQEGTQDVNFEEIK